MTTYKITGSRQVAGRPPGSILSQEDLAGCNITALIRGGHLTPNPTKAPKAESDQEK